jgi:hypothetical protein
MPLPKGAPKKASFRDYCHQEQQQQHHSNNNINSNYYCHSRLPWQSEASDRILLSRAAENCNARAQTCKRQRFTVKHTHTHAHTLTQACKSTCNRIQLCYDPIPPHASRHAANMQINSLAKLKTTILATCCYASVLANNLQTNMPPALCFSASRRAFRSASLLFLASFIFRSCSMAGPRSSRLGHMAGFGGRATWPGASRSCSRSLAVSLSCSQISSATHSSADRRSRGQWREWLSALGISAHMSILSLIATRWANHDCQ